MAMIDDVCTRIQGLGYTVTQTDRTILTYVLDSVKSEVMNKCNLSTVPEKLNHVVIDATAGRFLKQKHDSGTLTGVDFAKSIQSITEGDATVSYVAVASPETVYMDYINQMCILPIDQIVKFRCLVW